MKRLRRWPLIVLLFAAMCISAVFAHGVCTFGAEGKLFPTSSDDNLILRAVNTGLTENKNNIKAVNFTDLNTAAVPEGAVTADYSADGDMSVIAWFDSDNYVLHIGGYGKITASESLNSAFEGGYYVKDISGLELLDTSGVTDMLEMFYTCGEKVENEDITLDLGSNFDTSNVTNMTGMFNCFGYRCDNLTIDLGDKFDTGSVKDMGRMFFSTGYEADNVFIDLGDNFNTANVKYMDGMFGDFGRLCEGSVTLDLGDNFDTSNVTDMKGMFEGVGRYCKSLTFDLGDKFDTSKVTDMSYMFSDFAGSSSSVTLDLGDKFDTSNVRDMRSMFAVFASSASSVTLDLGDKFDTSKVTNMSYMFYYFASSASSVTIDPGAKFETGNLKSVYSMFAHCAANSSNFRTLDLSGFKFDSNMHQSGLTYFAYNCPADKFIFGEGWDNAKLGSDMFYLPNPTETTIVNAGENLLGYDWEGDNRTVYALTTSYVITAEAGEGGSVSGGGFVDAGGTITLMAAANEGYTFEGWYEGEIKVCETAEFVVENVTDDKVYTAKFTKNKVYYTITAEAGEGGSVSGGGQAEEGGTITLMAAANEGYTFEGWYEGEIKVCETAEFVVENVTDDKIYTAKFTAEQPEPEPAWEKPFLEWDGTTLTLTDNSGAAQKVGIIYTGGKAFNGENIDWYELVKAGREYINLNTKNGYAIYTDFTSRSPQTVGNYVAFVKYTNEEGLLTTDYITFGVGNYQSFDIPALVYDNSIKTLYMTGEINSTVGVAYVGDVQLSADSMTWDEFITEGAKHTDKNGSSGYAKTSNTTEYSKTFGTLGNFAAFIKYTDPNMNKTVVKYYTFVVSDDVTPEPEPEPEPEPSVPEPPSIDAEGDMIVLNAEGKNVTKVTINYIGTEDKVITDWDSFVDAAKPYSRINGADHSQQYFDPSDGTEWRQNISGYYEIYVRYTEDGVTYTDYSTQQITATTAPPEAAADGESIVVEANNNTIDKVCVAYIGTEDKYIDRWDDYVAAGSEYADINGEYGCVMTMSPYEGQSWAAEEEGYYCLYIRYTTADGVTKAFYTNLMK